MNSCASLCNPTRMYANICWHVRQWEPQHPKVEVQKSMFVVWIPNLPRVCLPLGHHIWLQVPYAISLSLLCVSTLRLCFSTAPMWMFLANWRICWMHVHPECGYTSWSAEIIEVCTNQNPLHPLKTYLSAIMLAHRGAPNKFPNIENDNDIKIAYKKNPHTWRLIAINMKLKLVHVGESRVLNSV